MRLSPAQFKTFWQLWPQACHACGWTKERGMSAAEIDAMRKAVLRGCGFNSLTEVDRTAGFTRVKNKLLILIGVSVQAGVEDQDATENTARAHRYVIEKEILPCLALYEEDVTGYVATVIAGLTRYYKTDRPETPPTLSDLSTKPTMRRDGNEGPSQMEQCLMTLNARVHAKRKAAHHSIHDMKTSAGLECHCAACCRRRREGAEQVSTIETLLDAGFTVNAEPQQPF